MSRSLPEELDPFAQMGAIANTTFLVAIASGALMLFWYSTSVHLAWSSLERLRAHAPLGQLMRSLHRYSSDACLFFAWLHALRMLFARRFAGPRVLAWVTGGALVAMLWIVGWLGYWLVWDVRGQLVATGTARMLDALPIFADPPSRGFLTDGAVSSLLFFIVFFAHMLIPLPMGIALWLHITRLSRSRFLTRTPMTVAVVASLVALSLVAPALNASPARMTLTPGAFSADAWYLLPLYLTDRLSTGALWSVFLLGGLGFGAIPWVLARGKAPTASVEVAKCNACRNCYNDCPYQAIKMVPRSDGRGYDVEAQVDASQCVGCGICSGSCDSSAIELPWLHVADARRRMDAWIDAAVAERGDVHVAMVCAESAGAALTIDPETGRCDALPGYRIYRAPCIGHVHMLTVERALRHGAAGVLLGACGPGDCQYREGADWTAERLTGAREPALRKDKAPAEKVRLVHHDRLATRDFIADAERFRTRALRDASPTTRGRRTRGRRERRPRPRPPRGRTSRTRTARSSGSTAGLRSAGTTCDPAPRGQQGQSRQDADRLRPAVDD